MEDNLNFSTQFYPLVRELRKWISQSFYPYIKKMVERKDTFRIYHLSLHNDAINILTKNNQDISKFDDLVAELSHFKNKVGLYGICLEVENTSAFIYIGKSLNLANRVRQHLTGKNLDQTQISESTAHKYCEIKELLDNNKTQNTSIFVWTSNKLTESNNVDYELGILETLIVAESKHDFQNFCTLNNLSLKSWNLRTG